MKMNIKMLKAAFAGLVLSVSGFSNAGLITVVNDATGTERASFGATDTMDWSVLGTSYTRLSNSFSTSTIEGNNLTVSQSGSGFERRDLSSGWGGNFTDGSSLLWNRGGGLADFKFSNAISGFGFQINPNFSDSQTIVEIFDLSNVSIGSWSLSTNNRGAASASFISFASDMTDISRFTIAQSGRNDFTINQLSLKAQQIPEPTTLAILAFGIMGLARKIKK